MRDVRRAHFDRSAELLPRFGGRSAEGRHVKTIGDAIMGVFRTAEAALNYALEIHDRPGHKELSAGGIRVGIHVGTVDVEVDDIFGADVNFAARIVDVIAGPEIWVSEPALGAVQNFLAREHRNTRWCQHSDVKFNGIRGYHRLWSLAAGQEGQSLDKIVLGSLPEISSTASQSEESKRQDRTYIVCGRNDFKRRGWTDNDISDQVCNLDVRTFGEDIDVIGQRGQWKMIFAQHPESWRAVICKDQRIVAFWHAAVFMPETYKRIMAGDLIGRLLRLSDYDLMEIPGIYRLYVAAICIDPEFRNPAVRLKLVSSFLSTLVKLSRNGIYFQDVAANGWSEEGVQICKSFGLKGMAKHKKSNSTIFGGPIDCVISRLRNLPGAERLLNTYRAASLYPDMSE